MPGLKQAWPMVAACWSPATPRIGISAPNSDGSVDAEIGGAVLHLRQQRGGMRRSFSSSSSHWFFAML